MEKSRENTRSTLPSTTAAGRLNAIAAVHLETVTPHGVVLTWIDPRGAHRTEITFERAARSPEELATLLGEHLHSDIC